MIAVFEKWKISGSGGIPGPFTVEVFEDPNQKKGHFRARILPTKVLFFEKKIGLHCDLLVPIDRRREVEVQILIEQMFEKKVTEWHDFAAGGRPKNTEDGN
jgi:hypothetical protein